MDPVELRGPLITDSSKFSIKLVQSSYDYTISFLIFRSRDNDLRYFFYSFVFNKRRNIITVSKLIYLRFRVKISKLNFAKKVRICRDREKCDR